MYQTCWWWPRDWIVSNRLTSGTFYENDMWNHFIITKVTLFRGKEEGWGEEGLKGVNIVPPPPAPIVLSIRAWSTYIMTLGPFIREKISRGLHKTRTPRINGTKSMFTAYSTQGQLKPRLILAEGFWDGLIQAAAYLGRENVRINALKLVQLLSTKIVHFYDKSMKLCQITTNPKTNIFGYGAKPNSTLDTSTAQALKWPTWKRGC